jgi:tetratricopeptide (TPR) repeat protein
MKRKTRKQKYLEIVSADDKELNACVIELSESYLKDFPDSHDAWLMYGFALYRTDRFKEAKKALIRTMKLTEESDDNLSWLFCRMGQSYEGSGKFNKAIEWYKKAHNLNPSEATFLIYQGVLSLRLGKYDEAAQILIKATNCSEGCIDEAFYNLGVVRIAQKRYNEALTCFEKTLEIDPKYKEAKQQLKDMKKVLEILENK